MQFRPEVFAAFHSYSISVIAYAEIGSGLWPIFLRKAAELLVGRLRMSGHLVREMTELLAFGSHIVSRVRATWNIGA
jgi:hypothetical protein